MYLKELTINGFKSFAKKSELEFSSSISAIVGPNGSGKSNVAESFRFVLGEQSVKAMRGKKGEDLIWGGSEKVARGNRASVEVLFDNSSRTFALDFDEVKIERVVHRDGQNEYKLNGSTVRLKDIHELLAGANIGSTGHHIISQGEADRILSASAKERREMIEDALGHKVYQIKKHEAERKLHKTLENIAQVESLRREAAPHLRYMKKQVERAERSLEVQQALKSSYAEYLKREDIYIARHFDRLTKDRHEPAEKLESVNEELEQVKEVLAAEENTELNEALTEAERAYRAATNERQQAERTVSGIKGQIDFITRRLEAPKTEAKPRAVVPQEKIEEIVATYEDKTNSFTEATEAATFTTFINDLLTALRGLLEEKAAVVVDTTEKDKAELAELQTQLEKANSEVEKAIGEERSREEKLQAARTALTVDAEKNHEAERNMFALREQRRELEAALQRIDSELAVLERDRAEFKRELQEAVTLIGRAASDYFNLEIQTEEGVRVSDEAIVAEDRDAQRTRRRELEKLKIRLEELGIGDTEALMKEYQEAKERDEFLAKELDDLNESVQNLQSLIADMQTKLEEQFTVGIEKISVEFNRFFTLMFGGGSASIERVTVATRSSDDEEEEQEKQEGVELKVSLPNKRVKGLNMLSGGERALTSIAVIFAMSQVNPPPFIILDETDAALDEANSRRYGDMIEELAKKSQLILITHNRETMSRAGILYGITMGADGVSKVLSVKFDEAAAVAK